MDSEIYFECSTIHRNVNLKYNQLYEAKKDKIIEDIVKILKDKYKISVKKNIQTNIWMEEIFPIQDNSR